MATLLSDRIEFLEALLSGMWTLTSDTPIGSGGALAQRKRGAPPCLAGGRSPMIRAG